MQNDKSITYTHENGYSATLYGEASMVVRYEGQEVMHTGFRNVNTEDEVMDLLEMQPRLRDSLERMIDEGGVDNAG